MDNPPLFTQVPNEWPARLLCIDDWTSYRRQDSDGSAWYGEDENPDYAIISYTWGRYRNDGRYTDRGFQRYANNTTPRLQVDGIKWAIPSIDPIDGFSAEEFENILTEIADRAGVNHVWVDVACIDQVHDADDQVGAQASIFRKASEAFIWLHQVEREDANGQATASLDDYLEDLLDAVDDAQRRRRSNERKSSAQRQREKDLVLPLFQDPYFSSLWTLQESFLIKDALLLSNKGNPASITLPGEREPRDVTLGDLIDICTEYLSLTGLDEELHQPIKEASLDSLAARNPMVTFRAARHRTSSKFQDRVFGIQQVFGVHVGPQDIEGKKRLSLLESKLSFKMNRACPSLAQIFIHRLATSGTASWKAFLGTFVPPRRHNPAVIEETLHVPEEFWDAEPVYNSPLMPKTMWDERYPDDLDFEGYSVPFEELWECWRHTERLPPQNENPADYGSQFCSRFDCSMHIDKSIYYADRRVIDSFPLEAARQIVRYCQGRVRILILGKIRNGADRSRREAWVGLLITRRNDGSFNRNGFCTWRQELSMRQSSRDVLRISGYDTEDPYMVSQDD